MAKLVQGYLGGFRGRLGTAVGTIRNGQFVIGVYNANPNQPNTVPQLTHRAKWSTIIAFLKSLTAFLRVGYQNLDSKMTAFNAAMKYNFKNAIMGAYPLFEIDYSKVLVSSGPLEGPLNPAIASTLASEIEFSWDDNTDYGDAAATDKALLLVYNPTKQKSVSVIAGNARSTESQAVTLPTSFTGDEVQCYMAFEALDGKVSNSQFVGEIVVA